MKNLCQARARIIAVIDGSKSNWVTSEITSWGCDKPFHAALPEIEEVLRSACETHKLPLAQTWMSCIQQGKDRSRHSDDNYVHCVSTVDHACHVADPCIQSFHEACSEHHSLRGQGIVGRAFMTNQPCFSNDITSLSRQSILYLTIPGCLICMQLLQYFCGALTLVQLILSWSSCQRSAGILNNRKRCLLHCPWLYNRHVGAYGLSQTRKLRRKLIFMSVR